MKSIILSTVVLFAVIKTVTPINCYVCNATDTSSPFQCGEWFERYDMPDIKPQDCSNVHGAKYCIKHIGRYEATNIKCYQCNASDTMDCSDLLINQRDSPIKPKSCKHVHEANYCIKSTALNGGIGAKRFCSSKDLGNYCNYVKNKGDQMEYRSCIFTCNTDGCNLSSKFIIIKSLLLLSTIIALFNKCLF